VILSDDKIAKELFIKRGNKYSNRGAPHAVEYISMNQNPAFRPKDGELLALLSTICYKTVLLLMLTAVRGLATPEELDPQRGIHDLHQ
jgi:hypothetical protein